jgi:hypothetical protein
VASQAVREDGFFGRAGTGIDDYEARAELRLGDDLDNPVHRNPGIFDEADIIVPSHEIVGIFASYAVTCVIDEKKVVGFCNGSDCG